jgi:hypothetical protein
MVSANYKLKLTVLAPAIFFLFASQVNASFFIPSYGSDKVFIIFPDTNFYSAYLHKKSDTDHEDCFIMQKKSELLLVCDGDFLNFENGKVNYSLMNFQFDFLTIKDNVIKYIDPELMVKVLYIMNNNNFVYRITDAMRSPALQNRYMRRGWSDRGSSPHMFGLAFDITNYWSVENRNKIREDAIGLGLKFLEHGRNRHIHLEDSTKWLNNPYFFTSEKSMEFVNKIDSNDYVMNIPIEVRSSFNYKNIVRIDFQNSAISDIKIIGENVYGTREFEITCGVFNTGNNFIFLNKELFGSEPVVLKIYERNNLISRKMM